MTSVGIDFRDAESKEGEREELEDFGFRRLGGYGGEEGVFGAGLGVGRGFEGT